MRELSVAEQRYQAVLAVISDGLSISQVASKVGVSRQTLHTWLARYEAEGLEGLVDRSHRPASCPHQMSAAVEAAVLELRRSRPYWGPRRLVFELTRRHITPVPSESAVYRALVRAQMMFTGRFNHPPTEVRFDAICRERGIEHLLTQPRSPTTTGKIERFHRCLRAEFLSTAQPFTSLKTAQQALDECRLRSNLEQ
ncbi:helix-turn-helix domain-containing protein, partial [Mycobacterium sp. E136]|uniref:helix-turn-helix domain-containing protein n=1 Tax=Mycobacterium sp. E136 TaxID=1834125 RepID=UPI0012E7E451